MGLNASDPLSADTTRWAGLAGSMSLLDKKPGAMEKLFGDLNKTVEDKFDGQVIVTLLPVQSYDTWLDFFEINFDNGTAGSSTVMVSRLIGEDALTGDPEAFQDAIKAATGTSELVGFYPLGGKGVHEATPRGGSNSVNPGWRKAYVHSRKSSPGRILPCEARCLLTFLDRLVSTLSPLPFNKTSEREDKKLLDESYEPLRKITPNMGAYLNEVSS